MNEQITGALFKRMVPPGAAVTTAQKQAINDLNVFPVPDGDTGTNMSMTIATAAEAVEFLRAGATAVAVGTANFANPTATVEVIDGIAQYCERHGVHDVNELIGALEC